MYLQMLIEDMCSKVSSASDCNDKAHKSIRRLVVHSHHGLRNKPPENSKPFDYSKTKKRVVTL